jgi:hypothetical protein
MYVMRCHGYSTVITLSGGGQAFAVESPRIP